MIGHTLSDPSSVNLVPIPVEICTSTRTTFGSIRSRGHGEPRRRRIHERVGINRTTLSVALDVAGDANSHTRTMRQRGPRFDAPQGFVIGRGWRLHGAAKYTGKNDTVDENVRK